ncbi:hypothetical protein [Paraburkholderia sp. 22B1P]|uniref:hypothetical protein n=1 Tax=Paraburkholderia sp. 22B1P TaxID=3080498 RepID=UPI003085B201|nr:SDR family NAD(P)-dependent oxidoreductase [Paraburkholderia sp. 22B1P]
MTLADRNGCGDDCHIAIGGQQRITALTIGTAVVSGALSLIGAAYANYLAYAGYDLIIVDRDLFRLSDLADELTNSTGHSVEVLVDSQSNISVLSEKIKSDSTVNLIVCVSSVAKFVTPGTADDALAELSYVSHPLNLVAAQKFTADGRALCLFGSTVTVYSAGNLGELLKLI